MNIIGNNALEIIDSNASIDHIVCNQNLYFEIRTKLNDTLCKVFSETKYELKINKIFCGQE